MKIAKNIFFVFYLCNERENMRIINTPYRINSITYNNKIMPQYYSNNIGFTGKKVIIQSFEPKELEVLFSEKEIQTRIRSLAQEINQYYGNNPVTMVTVMKGALPFSMDLSKRLKMPVLMEFIRLSSREGSRLPTGKLKEINMDLPDLNDKNVLIVEDIVGTGLTGKHVVDYINTNFKPKSLKFCTFINKEAVREYNFHPDFVGFNINNDKRFVLGYGLDDKGYCRNLPFVGYDEPKNI